MSIIFHLINTFMQIEVSIFIALNKGHKCRVRNGWIHQFFGKEKCPTYHRL